VPPSIATLGSSLEQHTGAAEITGNKLAVKQPQPELE